MEHMAYIRKKNIKGKVYYYVVTGEKDPTGKVKQKVVLYMGNIERVLKVFKFYKRYS